ncbi:helix-turn-helix transcriptional regulator [Actinokineospora cianjurensis]|uniref:Helix-turn-helix protein n=1 Tax=Actinokineospora cianjurensis TaxID=585224 RepID=A0A421AYZ2_9PSEU|nr:helix-turn-helix transcriptional regulator [Actinokineospora cianjurensis]RLK55083.1 helix-turn-helix protein [Actinokineospora cianjurensis]
MGKSGGTSRRREELGHFLTTRRARLSPAEIGLSVSSGRRRTPGLRREEVAVLAGIGTSWYTWLEQGRDINVSEPVARAVGHALRLNRSELCYLYQLLGISPPQAGATVGEHPNLDLRQVVDECLPSPALVVDSLWNLVASNRSARLVFGLTDRDRNLLTSFFCREEIWSRYANPDRMARMAVAQFRVSAAGHYDDPIFNNLIRTLCAQSEKFTQLWHTHEVLDARLSSKEVDHPEVGRLSFDTQSWLLDGPDRIRMFLHVPHRMSDTRAKLAALLAAEPHHADVSAVADRATA